MSKQSTKFRVADSIQNDSNFDVSRWADRTTGKIDTQGMSYDVFKAISGALAYAQDSDDDEQVEAISRWLLTAPSSFMRPHCVRGI